MKKVIEKTIFICDNEDCKKQETLFDKRFPYEKDWVYLHNFEFKVASNKQNPNKEKHFCCRNCMVIYMNKKLEEAFKMICLFG